MLNISELKAELARRDISVPTLANAMGISKKRLYSRINQKTSFTQKEISLIGKILGLDNQAILRIFFDSKVS